MVDFFILVLGGFNFSLVLGGFKFESSPWRISFVRFGFVSLIVLTAVVATTELSETVRVISFLSAISFCLASGILVILQK